MTHRRKTRLRIWDLNSGKLLTEMKNGAPEWGMDFSPDGNRIAVAGERRSIEICDVRTGQVLSRLPCGIPPHFLLFDPEGKRLAVSSFGSTPLEVRDTVTGTEMALPDNSTGVWG